jgi:hypothetical protein
MQGDLFQTIPDLDCLPEPILGYRTRGTIKPAIFSCEEVDGSQDSCILNEKKLAVDKLLWIFEANSLVFGDLSTHFVKWQEMLSSEGDVHVRRRIREQRVFNRPFRRYLHRVRLSFISQQEYICNELRRHYRSMFRSSASHWLIRRLHHRISYLLSAAPDLISIFETFVPTKFRRTWSWCDRKLKFKQLALPLASKTGFNFGAPPVSESPQAAGSGTSLVGGKHMYLRTKVRSISPSTRS